MAPVEVEDLLEAYKHTINSILNFPCTIDDELLTRIHEEILNELLEVGGAHGLNTSGLKFQVLPLIQQAREKNITRKFDFTAVDGTKIRGRYTSPIFEDCEIIGGSDNTKVLSEIRSWLCDFGDKHNKFQCDNYGYISEIGRSLDVIKSKLTVSSLMPDILRKSCVEVGSEWEHILCSAYYVAVEPFKIRFWYHEPSDVSGQLSLTKDTINFSIKGVDLPCNMPKISPESELRAVFTGDIEYEIKKGVYTRPWSKWVTFGIGFAFDVDKTIEKVHKIEMRMKCKVNRVKLREKININISRDECDKFMKCYKKYEEIESIQYKEYRNQLSILEADAAATMDFQRSYALEPWREFMQCMREGGPKAINELVQKKPTILKNLPKDINNAAGIAFEELMIARVMAEAQKQGVPLELHAGDGQGRYQYNGATVRTPEYTDAVFYNRQTKQYYSVQFKCSDMPDNLVRMMFHYRRTHKTNQPNEGTVPDACLLDNVQLIGPREVVDELLACSKYKKKINVGFEVDPIKRDQVISFLENNKKAMKRIVENEELMKTIEAQCQIKKEINTAEEKLYSFKKGLEAAKEKLSQGNGNVENLKKEIDGRTKAVDKRMKDYEAKKAGYEATREKVGKVIRKEMNGTVMRTAAKQLGIAATAGAVTDGVISLVIAFDTELKRYFKGEITAKECASQIFKKTAIGLAKGASVGTAFAAPTVIGQLASYAGYSTAGSTLSAVGKYAGPAVMAGMVGYAGVSILSQWNAGDITTADAEKAAGRLGITTGLNIGGIVAGSSIGGLPGLAVGVAVAITVGIGDYFFGDWFMSLFIKEDPEEAKALIIRKQKQIVGEVLEAAYRLFNLTEHATDEELRDAVRAARLKYHPDKDGDAEIFKAVEAAYSVIKAHRESG